MKRKFIIAVSMMAAVAAAGGAQAGEGGGSGGGSNSSSTETVGAGNLHHFFGGRIPGRALIAHPEPSGSTILPGGSVMRLDGFKANRDVVVATPEFGRFRGKHIKTTYNPATGITSVWIRNGDGTRTGIHTDRAGNQMVSDHQH
jgi:hypothetical protein